MSDVIKSELDVELLLRHRAAWERFLDRLQDPDVRFGVRLNDAAEVLESLRRRVLELEERER